MAAVAARAVVRSDADADEVAARALRVARRTALGILGDQEAAADVAQEVAIQVVTRHHALRDPAALEAWTHRIVVRAALREARRGHRRRAAEQARHLLDPAAPVDEALDATLVVLDGLPSRQRAALTLRYVHDLTDAEIAGALRCRPATVRSLLSRGRDAVRSRLDEDHR